MTMPPSVRQIEFDSFMVSGEKVVWLNSIEALGGLSVWPLLQEAPGVLEEMEVEIPLRAQNKW